jgi:hypothetical protein
MLIDFRPHTRLRGTNPVDIGASVNPLLEAPTRHSATGPGAAS